MDQHNLPPYSTENEQAVLGCVLVDPALTDRLLNETSGDEDAFYDVRHKVIFNALAGMSAAGIPVDLITLSSWLKDRKNLEMCGGRGYLSELPDKIATPAMFGTYMAVVSDKWKLRRVLKSLNECVADVFESVDAVPEIVDRIESRIIHASKIGQDQKNSWSDGRILAHKALDFFQRAFEASSGGKTLGIPTGFIDLDNVMSGLRAPEVTIIAARPSCGKTALAMNMAQNVSELGIGVGVFSLETNDELLGVRTLSHMAHVSSRSVSSQADFTKLAAAAGRLAKLPLYIKDDCYGIDQIRREARRLCSEKKVGLLVVDYLQLIVGDQKRQRHDEVGQCSRGLKLMAKELGVPVIALAQISREVESDKNKGRAPRLSDLRESGSIEQDADNVIFLHRRRNPNDPPDDSGSEPYAVSLIIAKQKMGPRDIEVDLVFHPQHTRFTNCSRQQI